MAVWAWIVLACFQLSSAVCSSTEAINRPISPCKPFSADLARQLLYSPSSYVVGPLAQLSPTVCSVACEAGGWRGSGTAKVCTGFQTLHGIATNCFWFIQDPFGTPGLDMTSPHDNQRVCLVYAVLIAQVLSVALATTGESSWV